MAKIKLTKNELKKQKDSLKRFERYLPTLVLKKQQLQIVIRQVESQVLEKTQQRSHLLQQLDAWIAVFGEGTDISQFLRVKEIKTSAGNIAGVDIPTFDGIVLDEIHYDLLKTAMWVDTAVEAVREVVSLDAELLVLERQKELLAEELRITTQRVNLFEKVKIPEAKNNIRRIGIYLGDEQTAAVVRGKIAKKNLAR